MHGGMNSEAVVALEAFPSVSSLRFWFVHQQGGMLTQITRKNCMFLAVCKHLL